MFPVIVCHRCELPGHGYRECQRPPAANKQELESRIDRILQRWDAGNGMSTYLKTELVTLERAAHEKRKTA